MNSFINREQLYREVWSTPLAKLAPKYNLTTYELKKLCDIFLVPLPKVGHWSKVKFGKTVEVPPLPVYDECRLKVKKVKSFIVNIPDKEIYPNIRVKKNLTNPHQITINTRDGLKRSRTDEYGMKKPWKKGFDLRVSKVNERRALLIIDTLCKWFDENNIRVYQPFENSTTTEVIIDDQRIRIKIEEKSKLTAKTLTKSWSGTYEYYTREYTPTEQLSLVIDNYCWGCSLRKVWCDGKISKVEEKLDEFVITLFKHARHEKERKLRLKIEEMKREKERKLQKYKKECVKLEKQMLDDLQKQSNNFIRSRELNVYINEVKNLARKQYMDGNYPEELRNWITWAERYAADLNPLSEGLPIYRHATEIIKLEDIDAE